jgi:hypothetical protein
MDNKQLSIFKRICDRFRLPYDCKFLQNRNLLEFKYFTIERINPNHHIILYGKLKHKKVIDNNYNKLIKVGELFLSYAFLFLPMRFISMDICYTIISSTTLFYFLYDLTVSCHIERFINAYWNRRRFRVRENNICS